MYRVLIWLFFMLWSTFHHESATDMSICISLVPALDWFSSLNITHSLLTPTVLIPCCFLSLLRFLGTLYSVYNTSNPWSPIMEPLTGVHTSYRVIQTRNLQHGAFLLPLFTQLKKYRNCKSFVDKHKGSDWWLMGYMSRSAPYHRRIMFSSTHSVSMFE